MNKYARAILGATALVGVVSGAHAAVKVYPGTSAPPGKGVQAVVHDEAAWYAAWEERLEGQPVSDLEGNTGVLIVPARPGRYISLDVEEDERRVVLRCVEHGTQNVGGWAAAIVEGQDRPVQVVGCL